MRSPALLALLLLVPLAAAGHPFPGPEERLREGEKLSIHVIFRGEASASGSQMKDATSEGVGSVYEDEHRWRSTWNWTATGEVGTLQSPTGGIELEGNATVDFLRAARRQTTSLHGADRETRITSSESVTDCREKAGPIRGLSSASFRLSGSEIVLTLQGAAGLAGATCEARVVEDDTHGEGRRSAEPTQPLLRAAFTTKTQDDGAIELRVPAAAGKTILRGSAGGALPAENEGIAGKLCGQVYASATGLTLECVATETIEVRIFVAQCDALARSAATHASELRATIAAPPADLAQASILAWAGVIAARTDALLADERAHELAGCAPPIEGAPALAQQGKVAVRDALGRAAAQGKLTREALVHLLGVEREVQIQSGPAPEGEVEAGVIIALREASARVNAVAEVSVHSPVALRAVALDGRTVGWNASRGASDVGVEGASSEGAAGGEQRLVLPVGGYHIEIDEQRFAYYLLEFKGPDGREERHLVRALPGGATRIPMGLVETSEGVALRIYSPERAAALAPATPETPDGEAPTPAEGANGAPGAGVALVLVALALAARYRR